MDRMRLELTDAKGQQLLCNGEGEWPKVKRALATWGMLELIGPDFRRDPTSLRKVFQPFSSASSGVALQDHPFIELYTEFTGGSVAGISLPVVVDSACERYRRNYGRLTDFAASLHFPTNEDQLTLFKYLRWACAVLPSTEPELRVAMRTLRLKLGLEYDPYALLLASGVEKIAGLKMLVRPEKSALPIAALAIKMLLHNDGRFDEKERYVLHALMVMLGIDANSFSDLSQHIKREDAGLAGEISPEDAEVALSALLRLAILDRKITSSEWNSLSTVIAATAIEAEALERVRRRVELDTGVRIRLDLSGVIDYGDLT